MNNSKISVRYAKALFELSLESGTLEATRAQAAQLAEVCSKDPLAEVIASPVVTADQKKSAITAFFGQNVSAQLASFISLVLTQRREEHLSAMLRHFAVLYRQHSGIRLLTIKSAAPLDQAVRKSLIALVEEQLKTKTEVEDVIDPLLLGGFVIQVDYRQIDASVAGKLEKIKEELLLTKL